MVCGEYGDEAEGDGEGGGDGGFWARIMEELP